MTDHRRGTPDAPVVLGGGPADAKAGADHVARFGPELVHGLFTAGRTLRIHTMDNRATRASLRRLMDTIDDFRAAEGRVTVTVATDLLVVNDVRLMVEPQHMGPILFLVDEMKKRRVEEIDFAPDVDIEELGRFVQAFFSDPAEEDAFGALSSRMAAAGITSIRLTEWIERARHLRDTRTDKKHIREESNKAMSRAVLFMGEVMRAIEQKHPVQIRKAHRLTQQMADIIKVDESVLVGLTSIKDYDEYTFAHSVNVSVLSMVIADHLGLPREQVAEIGVAGLLHDIGKTHIPLSILNKPGRLSPEEWDIMARHPMLGVIELTRVRSLRSIAAPLFVTLEHHVHFAGGGYPQKPGAWDLHPHTLIVSVADVFDAMTTHRTYRTNPVTPERALRFIHAMSGKLFDPLVARTFIHAMGVYPNGTVVELDTGETGVVVRQNREVQYMHRPFVALMNGAEAAGEPVNLAARARAHAHFERTIVRSASGAVPAARRAGCFITD
ncbi:MAG TPA: HD-GYP domain-containing protein [Candidatus Krumholzibacteria bacterium]|nr:HD-GYP domain-containing protein [Candidatus Krumholzibacteria bacterium]